MTSETGSRETNKPDCVECRMIGGGILLSASGYVFYHARKMIRPWDRTLAVLFGGGK